MPESNIHLVVLYIIIRSAGTVSARHELLRPMKTFSSVIDFLFGCFGIVTVTRFRSPIDCLMKVRVGTVLVVDRKVWHSTVIRVTGGIAKLAIGGKG
jgi:hypothetical protein